MTRKQILSIWVVMLLAFALSVVAISLSPVWLSVLMVKPSLIDSLSRLVTQKMTKVMMGMMFARGKTPTMPVRQVK